VNYFLSYIQFNLGQQDMRQLRILPETEGRGKVLPMARHRAMKAYGGGDKAPRFLTLGTGWRLSCQLHALATLPSIPTG